jgi:TatD DNase family protein
MLLDAHAHLDLFGDRLDEALRQIEEHRILTLAVGMDVPSYLETRSLAARSQWVRPLFGVHPWEAPRYADDLPSLDEHFAATPMIGEAGLDFHFVEDARSHEQQRVVFRYQCDWAARSGKRMNLHTKGAEAEVLAELRSHGLQGSIVHWYSGPAELVADYLAFGCYFTIGVEVLSSEAVRQLARSLPAESLLLETDNPGAHRWLTGSPGMPALLLDVRDAVAEQREVTPAQLDRQLAANWQRLEWVPDRSANGRSDA